MKARFFKKVSVGLALSALPFVGGGDPETTNTTQSSIAASTADPLIIADANTAPAPGESVGPEPAVPTAETAMVATPAPNAGQKPPTNVKLSNSANDIVKLAQSGVDDSIMLSYISNSASLFNLSSDQIIYLNDLGVSDGVVTAMIQRDQVLKQSWAEAAQPAEQPAEAAAPTYASSPETETQPPQVVEAAPTQPVNVSYNYFYDSLSPYGTWINIDGYGSCWQPTVVVINSGWSPYCDRGRWLYTDAGWYWSSDYSWGWAAFHYGRWFHHPRWGWCWYPGYVWGPAWVTWRYNSGYCGWAPLPPAAYYRPGFGFYYQNHSVGFGFSFGLSASAYTFVSWGNFCDRRPWHHRLPTTRVRQIYNGTTVVNNFGVGDHHRIINHGIPIDRVREHSRSEIRQIAIRETPNASGFGTRGERLERDGRTLLVHRPNVARSTTATGSSPRLTRGSQRGQTPTSGAGAAALMESAREQGHARMSAEARARFARPQVSAPTATSPMAREQRGNFQSTPAGNGIRTAPPTPRGRDARPNVPSGGRNRDRSQSSTASPLIVRGGESRATVSPPVQQRAPAGSLVVIGRRNSGQERSWTPARTETSSGSTRNWTANRNTTLPAAAPQLQTPRVSTPSPSASRSFNPSTIPTPRYERHEVTRQHSVPSRSYSAPVHPSPSPRSQFVAPSYSARQFTPAPSRSVPSYSAPRSAPAPAPARSYRPAPSRAPSSESHSWSSGRGNSSHRGRN